MFPKHGLQMQKGTHVWNMGLLEPHNIDPRTGQKSKVLLKPQLRGGRRVNEVVQIITVKIAGLQLKLRV